VVRKRAVQDRVLDAARNANGSRGLNKWDQGIWASNSRHRRNRRKIEKGDLRGTVPHSERWTVGRGETRSEFLSVGHRTVLSITDQERKEKEKGPTQTRRPSPQSFCLPFPRSTGRERIPLEGGHEESRQDSSGAFVGAPERRSGNSVLAKLGKNKGYV